MVEWMDIRHRQASAKVKTRLHTICISIFVSECMHEYIIKSLLVVRKEWISPEENK